MRVGDRVRVFRPYSAAHGATGRVVRLYSAMEQCLVELDAGTGIVWVSTDAVEAV